MGRICGAAERQPCVFEDQHLTTEVETQHGRVILQIFRERSKLLRSIENYCVAILKANPQTSMVPNHWDAESWEKQDISNKVRETPDLIAFPYKELI